jgi:hypothetical protein
MENELWALIDGWPEYSVSTLGRIRNNRTNFIRKARLKINLRRPSQMKSFRVPRLVALAFLPNPYHLPHVIHINGNPLDNRVENLQWVSTTDKRYISGKQRAPKRMHPYSLFKGVTWRKDIQRWQTGMWVDGKQKHLGYFDREEDAGAAYQQAAVERHDERLNQMWEDAAASFIDFEGEGLVDQ